MKRAHCILYGATALLLAAAVYSVDEDRDGRTDRELFLEQSDTLA